MLIQSSSIIARRILTKPSVRMAAKDVASFNTKGDAKSYMIVHNIAKKANVGMLARSCSAFGTLLL